MSGFEKDYSYMTGDFYDSEDANDLKEYLIDILDDYDNDCVIGAFQSIICDMLGDTELAEGLNLVTEFSASIIKRVYGLDMGKFHLDVEKH